MEPSRALDRNHQLDALRGICALVVVFYHLTMLLPGVNGALWAAWWPRPLIAGPSAVFVFFALSGYVLQIAFAERGGQAVAPFLLRRFGRIYPPVVAAVLLGLVMVSVLRPADTLPDTLPMSDWARQFWTHPFGAGDVIAPLVLGSGRLDLDPPLWSIVIELRYSLAFPLIALAVLRWGWHAAAAALACSLATALVLPEFVTLRFAVLFTAGAALAFDRARCAALLARIGAPVRAVLLVAAIMLLCQEPGAWLGMAVSLGAVLLVALVALGQDRPRWADAPVLRWLGQVSYSLYLVHFPIMLGLTYALGRFIPLSLVLALVLPASLAAAQLCWRWVELPAIALGRRLAMRPTLLPA